MTHFRLRYRRLGGHVHVALWSGTERETTHGRNGDMVFRCDEWDDFMSTLAAANVEFIDEGEA